MAFIEVNGIKMHYITNGEGPDIVMVHGLLGNLAVWHFKIGPALRKAGYRITTLDMRGHGYSEIAPSGYTSEALAADLLALLDALDIESAHILGHSYGADVCMHLALLHPDRVKTLLALEPGLPALVEERKKDHWGGWTYWVGRLKEAGFEVPPEKRTDFRYLLKVSLETPKFYGPARGLPRKRGRLLELINNTSLVSDYEVVGSLTLGAVRKIETPTLLVYGENSYFLGSYEFLREALPNCTPVLLPGGEHFGPLEQPEMIIEHILDFVKC